MSTKIKIVNYVFIQQKKWNISLNTTVLLSIIPQKAEDSLILIS